MAVILLPFLSFANLMIISEKSSYFDEGWLFIGNFKAESVLGIRNKNCPILEKCRNLLFCFY